MTPSEFLQTVVRPNVVEFNTEYGDVRRANNAVASVDALAAHIYVWCKTKWGAGACGRRLVSCPTARRAVSRWLARAMA